LAIREYCCEACEKQDVAEVTMRGLQFELESGQQRRVSKAQERLKDAAGSVHAAAFVNVGDTIQVDHEAGFLRGHGTQVVNGELLATVCGIVERVNKLVSVRPLRAKYNPETGDVVVGRITEVAPKRWKVDVNCRQDAQLMLSAVNLPGGIQRRRTAVDELNMRSLYEENDIISAEVQSLYQDGSLHLHTRSLKYGKLENGQLVTVAPYLIKRLKQHFHHLKQYGVDLILGCNGYVWIAAPSESGKSSVSDTPMDLSNDHGSEMSSKHSTTLIPSAQEDGKRDLSDDDKVRDSITRELRERICRLANAVRVLAALGLLIFVESIIDTYEVSLSWDTAVKDMLAAEFCIKIVEREAEHRDKKELAI